MLESVTKPEFSKTPAIFDGQQEYIDQTKSKIGVFICNVF